METVEVISTTEVEIELECDECGKELSFIIKETKNGLRVIVDKCKHCTVEEL